jgi:hypothetical protein
MASVVKRLAMNKRGLTTKPHCFVFASETGFSRHHVRSRRKAQSIASNSPKGANMTWDHLAKQKENALIAINRPRPYRPLKVMPHDPARDPGSIREIGGWFGTEIFLIGKSPEQMETLLGFCVGYLTHGVDVFEFARAINADDIDLLGAYTYLPGGKERNQVDLKWPPGLGAPQWKLKRRVPCRFIRTVPRGPPVV